MRAMKGIVERPDNLPKYGCHKEVWALKIKKLVLVPDGSGAVVLTPVGDYAPFVVLRAYIAKHNPQPGGYWVRYEDGYESYSPAVAFELGYTRVNEAASATDQRGLGSVRMAHEAVAETGSGGPPRIPPEPVLEPCEFQPLKLFLSMWEKPVRHPRPYILVPMGRRGAVAGYLQDVGFEAAWDGRFGWAWRGEMRLCLFAYESDRQLTRMDEAFGMAEMPVWDIADFAERWRRVEASQTENGE